MPDLRNRDAYERKLLAALRAASTEIYDIVLRELGYPPDASKITHELMERIRVRYGEAMTATLAEIFIEAARGMAEAGVPFDLDELEAAAAPWAAALVAERTRQMNVTTQNWLLRAVGSGIIGAAAWQAAVARIFGGSRMQNIAITETTGAASSGERAVAEQVTRRGNALIPRWHTAEDDRVCPICKPRHGEVIRSDYPPAHHGCRCWIEWKDR